MSTQPEALRLADLLDECKYVDVYRCKQAAAELRRLHEENAELRRLHAQCDALLEALKQSLEEAIYPSKMLSDVYEKARAAIKAVEEGK